MTISHLKYDLREDGGWIVQSNEEHCGNVAAIASEFAGRFGLPRCGSLLGILHDRGKEKTAFQNYIKRSSGYDPSAPAAGPDLKAHSYVGAMILNRPRYDLFSNIVAGHHRGLYNGRHLEVELKRPFPEEIEMPSDLPYPDDYLTPLAKKLGRDRRNHLIRLLFSCLVDADRLDTERFLSPETYDRRGHGDRLESLLEKLEAHLLKFGHCRESEVNRIRKEVQDDCRKAAEWAPGVFSLTVPTGGGKTLSSVLWALLHAVRYGKSRIVVAIPYTGIVAQTADILKGIFGEENVLEHHGNVDYDEADDKDTAARLATQNWDAPIIVTTNVQLLESMFSNKPGKCRKLHNLVDSVVIFDEAQALPTQVLQPIVEALQAYVDCFGVSILFSTASQPSLTGTYPGSTGQNGFRGFEEGTVREIIPPERNLSRRLKRVDLHFDDMRPLDYDEIAERLLKHPKVLCVVNSRRHAMEIFRRIAGDDKALTVHLSRNMCPAHISDKLSEVKEALKDDTSVVRVISTQLIEAGVDIDFPVVYRQLAGLDSILQASGRCNREGRLPSGDSYVFEIAGAKTPGYIARASSATRALLDIRSEIDDWFAPETIGMYFKQLYSRLDGFDTHDIGGMLHRKFKDIDYEDAAETFRLIENEGASVAVPYGDGAQILAQFEATAGNGYFDKSLFRKLGRYTVEIPRRMLDELVNKGVARAVTESLWAVDDVAQYDGNIGIRTESHWINELIIIE